MNPHNYMFSSFEVHVRGIEKLQRNRYKLNAFYSTL